MRAAVFTDNDFDKVNGVTTTLKAMLQFAAGDKVGYRDSCERIVSWKIRAPMRYLAILACVLDDHSVDEPEALVRLANATGAFNDKQYNWYDKSDIQRGKRERWSNVWQPWQVTMPYFVMYRFPTEFAGSTLCSTR